MSSGGVPFVFSFVLCVFFGLLLMRSSNSILRVWDVRIQHPVG